jgi:hypothetical protein
MQNLISLTSERAWGGHEVEAVMRRWTRLVTAPLAGILMLPAPGRAEEHLVSRSVIEVRLAAEMDVRNRDLAILQGALSSPRAAAAASAVGVDISMVRAAVPSLSDGELRDLAARAAALDRDPAAGLSRDVDRLLVIFLIVAIVLLLLKL